MRLAVLAFACGTTACGESKRTLEPRVMRGGIGVYEFRDVTQAWATYGSSFEDPCELETVGHCTIRRYCPEGLLSQQTLDAGSVTVQSTALGYSASYGGVLPTRVAPGDVLQMAATGSIDVPAHQGTVTVPVPIKFSQYIGVLLVDRSLEFHVSWSGGEQSTITVTLVALDAMPRVNVKCSARGDAGALIIPPTVLARLPASDGSLSISQDNIVILEEASWQIALSATHDVASTDIVIR